MLIAVPSPTFSKMRLLGEDGSRKRGGGLTSSPESLSPSSSLRREEAGEQVENLLQGSLLPAGGAQGISQVFKPLGFFTVWGKCPLCCREPGLACQGKERNVCVEPQVHGATAFYPAQWPCPRPPAAAKEPGSVREEAPEQGLHLWERGRCCSGAALELQGRAAPFSPSSPFCLQAPFLCPLSC